MLDDLSGLSESCGQSKKCGMRRQAVTQWASNIMVPTDVIPNRAQGPVRNLLFPDAGKQQIPHRRFAPVRNDIRFVMALLVRQRMKRPMQRVHAGALA
jgi:hypothetical protein